MATRKTTSSDAISRVLDQIPAEQILNPQPLYLQVGAERYAILPMPDSALMIIGDTLAQTAGFVEQIANMGLAGSAIGIADVIGLAPMIGPELVCLLVPSSTKIIAACLRKDEQWVQDNLRVHQRLEALKLILEAEHLPTILSAFTELVTLFQTAVPAPSVNPALETPAPVETPGTEAPSTNSSVTSTDGPTSS